ncbi:hypothetical protein [Spiribacter vilamensis]|uniref:Uncharacterized protein n=1 Tax=Spiribacter vilamensis TaxID=531306 RepID=A0A4Q8D0H4_9GAMM|nr:hypothetical protein [Spiribacter vilamensis]RZU98727.1 hypothetical protein EV698_0988 [Spiribacter vilamensis]TVO62249.1 hypothetical protein FPL09_09270 [Spiribacter vilamensis]
MTLTPAHWITPDGDQLEVQTSHIASVIADPARFGVTEGWLRSMYAEHGEAERFGCEGRARAAIIHELVLKGWIRTRRYIRPATYWSLTVDELDDSARRRLREWVGRERQADRLKNTTEVRIQVLDPGELIKGEVAELEGWL